MSQPLRENRRSLPKSIGKDGSKTKNAYALFPSHDTPDNPIDTDLRTAVRYVRRLYKRGCFDSTLKDALIQLSDCCRSSNHRDASDYWKGQNLLYELNEILDFNVEVPDYVFSEGYGVKQEVRT